MLQLVVTNVHGEDVVGRFLGATAAAAMTAEYEPTRHEATKALLGQSRLCGQWRKRQLISLAESKVNAELAATGKEVEARRWRISRTWRS